MFIIHLTINLLVLLLGWYGVPNIEGFGYAGARYGTMAGADELFKLIGLLCLFIK